MKERRTGNGGARLAKRNSSVAVRKAIPLIRIRSAQLAELVHRVLSHEGQSGHVEVVVGGDRLLKSLNAKFLGKDKPTDVLSFPLGDGVIGEVYCNYDHCRRWQRDHGGTLTSELSRLAVHGTLHLLGYNHNQVRDLRAMKEAEERYLGTSGLINHRHSRVHNA